MSATPETPAESSQNSPTPLDGLHAYSTRCSVTAGDSLDVCISNDGPVNVEIVQFNGSSMDDFVTVTPPTRLDAEARPISRGSYIFVENGVTTAAELTVEAWVRPLAEQASAGLLWQRGFRLGLRDGTKPYFAIDVGEVPLGVEAEPLELGKWTHLVGTFEGRALRLYVDGEAVAVFEGSPVEMMGDGPIFIGSADGRSFLTGDLHAPAIYGRCLSASEILARFLERDSSPASECIGHWTFASRDNGQYLDTSGYERHGTPVRNPIGMIPGPKRLDDRRDLNYDPADDPDFGYAVRFLRDSFVNCDWPTTFSWQVERHLESGCYAVRITNDANEHRLVPFVICAADPAAKVLIMMNTITRSVHHALPFDSPEDYNAKKPHTCYPMPGRIIGTKRPASGMAYGWDPLQLELPLTAWLSKNEIEFEVCTDLDVHTTPEMLDHYHVIAWAGHSSYWTRQMHQTLEAFVARGGHLVSLAGGSGHWRASIDEEAGTIEVRKRRKPQSNTFMASNPDNSGYHHQTDGRLGRTLLHDKSLANAFLGSLASGSVSEIDIHEGGGYEVIVPDHWLFREPREVDFDEPFATGAVGFQFDTSIGSLCRKLGQTMSDTPATELQQHFAMLDPQGVTVLCRAKVDQAYAFGVDGVTPDGSVWCEMILVERPRRGMVFNAASALAAIAAYRDDNFGALLLNLLEHLGVEATEPEDAATEHEPREVHDPWRSTGQSDRKSE